MKVITVRRVDGDVLVRVSPSFRLAMHIDTDEANAANVQSGAPGFGNSKGRLSV